MRVAAARLAVALSAGLRTALGPAVLDLLERAGDRPDLSAVIEALRG